VIGASLGVWMFYVQHQFEETYWHDDESWNHPDAALYGSSYYDLPPVLAWLTGYIGIHHVHHLYGRIPFYRLPEVLAENPELADIRRLTIKDSFKTVRLRLWDSAQNKMVGFADIA